MNKTLIISRKEAKQLLTIEECIPVMAQTLKDISENRIQMLQRNMMHHDNGNILALMPSTLNSKKITGSKVIIFPGPETRKNNTNQGVIPIFSTETGALLAIIDGESITITRTAAASAAATDDLARKDASSLAILGAGNQGKAHAEAMTFVRDIDKIYVWDINHTTAKDTCAYLSAKLSVECSFCSDAETAVKNADIICTVTNASEPILKGQWLKKGSHINAVGACSATSRELDYEAIKKGALFIDQTEACLRDAGDFLIPLKEKKLSIDHIQAEIGNVISGKVPGRVTDNQITIFETVGLAVEDLAAAWFIYEKAKKAGIGIEVEI